MGFFSKKRDEYLEQGIDPARVPPGQYLTDRFPVLHAGPTPKVDVDRWTFEIGGLVETGATFDYQEFTSLPAVDRTFDIHCVTKWSKVDTSWHGVAVQELMSRVTPKPQATHVLLAAEQGFTANLPMQDFLLPENLFAWEYDGQPLDIEHGWPLRLVVPHLYFWKSVKWVRGFQLLDHDEPGFWERNGYHMRGDPFEEQRYWGD